MISSTADGALAGVSAGASSPRGCSDTDVAAAPLSTGPRAWQLHSFCVCRWQTRVARRTNLCGACGRTAWRPACRAASVSGYPAHSHPERLPATDRDTYLWTRFPV